MAIKNMKTNELEQQWGIRAPEELGSIGVAQTVSGEEIDFRLKKSTSMVDGSVRGLAENQRRIRYFGFEAAHEQVKRTCDELGVCQKINCEVCQ